MTYKEEYPKRLKYLNPLRNFKQKEIDLFNEYDIPNGRLNRLKRYKELEKIKSPFFLKKSKIEREYNKIREEYRKKYPRKREKRKIPSKNAVIISFAKKTPDLWKKISPTKFIEYLLKKESLELYKSKPKKTCGRSSAFISKNLLSKWKKLTNYCKCESIQVSDFLETELRNLQNPEKFYR